MGKQETLETIWEVRTSFGNGSNLSSWRKTRPKPGAASALTHDRCSTASSSGCAAGANGTDCRKSLGTTAPFIAPFNGGWGSGVLHRTWGALVRGAKSWMAWTGNGRRQTEPWARHVLGGPDWAQPYGPWQGWYQAQSPCGWRGRPLAALWLREQTCTRSCWRRPWTPLWSNDHSPPRRNPNTSILQGAAAGHGYRESVPSSEEKLDASGESGIRRAGGLWNGLGMALQVPCETRRQRTTVCYSLDVRSCGSGDSGVGHFELRNYLKSEPQIHCGF